MAGGVPMNYGPCEGGPWKGKHLAHHEPVYVVPINRDKKIIVAVQPGTKGYIFGKYRFADGVWSWVKPESCA